VPPQLPLKKPLSEAAIISKFRWLAAGQSDVPSEGSYEEGLSNVGEELNLDITVR
jgi:hypothetical protein